MTFDIENTLLDGATYLRQKLRHFLLLGLTNSINIIVLNLASQSTLSEVRIGLLAYNKERNKERGIG
jgi:hypothetical protein